jgi:uncharacterized membrane protein
MSMDNRDIMGLAKAHLRGNWDITASIFLMYMVIIFVLGVIPVMGWIAGFLIAGPLLVGLHIIFLSVVRDITISPGQLFEGFYVFTNCLVAYILTVVFISLWSLLLIVPGIIAAFSYSMTYFILADNHQLDGREAIRQSKTMMAGNKWKLSGLVGRFTGWFLLGILSLGIGFIWIGPYFMTSLAIFYEEIRDAQPISQPVLQIVPGS